MNKRKEYLIDKDFQYKFILRNLVFILVSSVFIFTLIVVWNNIRFKQNFLTLTPTNSQLNEWESKHHADPDSMAYACQFIIQSKEITFDHLVREPLMVTVLLNMIIAIIISIYFSHRMAGPMYRIKTALKMKLEGKKAAPIILRKGDLFVEVAELLNTALDLKDSGNVK